MWPPVLVGTQISLSGVDRSLLGTIKRPDGSVQLTLLTASTATDTGSGTSTGSGGGYGD